VEARGKLNAAADQFRKYRIAGVDDAFAGLMALLNGEPPNTCANSGARPRICAARNSTIQSMQTDCWSVID